MLAIDVIIVSGRYSERSKVDASIIKGGETDALSYAHKTNVKCNIAIEKTNYLIFLISIPQTKFREIFLPHLANIKMLFLQNLKKVMLKKMKRLYVAIFSLTLFLRWTRVKDASLDYNDLLKMVDFLFVSYLALQK